MSRKSRSRPERFESSIVQSAFARNRARLHDQVRADIPDLVTVLSQHDLFDLLELVRQMELPLGLDGYKESEFEGLAAAVDIVALLGLASDSVAARAAAGSDQRRLGSISDSATTLDSFARKVLNLAVMSAPLPDESGLGELAGELRGQEIFVRNKQYKSIAEATHQELFGPAHVQSTLRRVLGFDYADLTVFREAMTDGYRTGISAMMTAVRIAAQHIEDAGFARLIDAARATMSYPAQHNEFTVGSLVALSGLSESVVTAILDTYAVGPSEKPAVQLVDDLVAGLDHVAGAGIVTDGLGRFFILSEPIPNDILRRRIEDRLKGDPKGWETYRKHRDGLLEKMATDYLAALLQAAPTFRSLAYYAPKPDTDTSALDRECANAGAVGLLTEADALFVVEDLAICVEAKAGAITQKARSGSTTRVATDLEKTIGEASTQAQRLRELILENGGVWLPRNKWLDLSQVREVRTVVACLDDFGPLAIAADALVRAGVLQEMEIPWIVSLHDLAVTARLVPDPATFLLYVRRRTDTSSVRTYSAVDELDLLMWFLEGGLYFDPDPDAVLRAHPFSKPPTSKERRAFKKRPISRVSTFTDELDAWMYFEEGMTETPAAKPERRLIGLTGHVLSHLRNTRRKGLRASATLVGASEESQEEFAGYAGHVLDQTAADGRIHTAAVLFASAEEFVGFFIASAPSSKTEATSVLNRYMTAKKHQMRLTSALGVVVDLSGAIVESVYLNEPWTPNNETDRLVGTMGLKTTSRNLPPYAQRTTRRMR